MRKMNILSSLFSMTDEQAIWRVQTQDDHHAFALQGGAGRQIVGDLDGHKEYTPFTDF